jgi:hypothetical protein
LLLGVQRNGQPTEDVEVAGPFYCCNRYALDFALHLRGAALHPSSVGVGAGSHALPVAW